MDSVTHKTDEPANSEVDNSLSDQVPAVALPKPSYRYWSIIKFINSMVLYASLD